MSEENSADDLPRKSEDADEQKESAQDVQSSLKTLQASEKRVTVLSITCLLVGMVTAIATWESPSQDLSAEAKAISKVLQDSCCKGDTSAGRPSVKTTTKERTELLTELLNKRTVTISKRVKESQNLSFTIFASSLGFAFLFWMTRRLNSRIERILERAIERKLN